MMDLVVQSATWESKGIGATVRFFDVENEPDYHLGPSPYEEIAIDRELANLGISQWRSKDHNDPVLCLSDISKDIVDKCIAWVAKTDLVDFRFVAKASPGTFNVVLSESIRLAYCSLPVVQVQNIDRTVSYCLSLLEKTRRSDAALMTRPKTSVGKREMETGVPPDARRACKSPQTSAASNGTKIVLTAGQPLSFGPSFTAQGFKIDPKCAREGVDGILVGAGSRGIALYGPYLATSPGQYVASASIRGLARFNESIFKPLRPRSRGSIVFDAFFAGLDKCAAEAEIPAGSLGDHTLLQLKFTVPIHAEPILLELRVHQRSNKNFLIESIELSWL